MEEFAGLRTQLQCLLDDVVLGKQEMTGAIDAVCDVAERIIGRLKEGAATAGPSVLAAAADGAGSYPPMAAMKRFADSLVRQKGIKPPPGYKTSISICRRFLNEHAPKKASDVKPRMQTMARQSGLENQADQSGPIAVRDQGRHRERRRHSRRGQGRCCGHVNLDRPESSR